jgi:hypothetical protein
MSLLNEEQKKLFSIILDNNYEYIHGETPTKKFQALHRMIQAKINLKKSMGEEAYDKFMLMGSKLFASKDQPNKITTSD